MVNLYDIAYAIGGTVSAPLWLVMPTARRKVFRALENQMGRVDARPGEQPAIMIHAVSLGEINATPELVRRLRAARAAGTIRFIISTTTETGFARGRQLYGDQPDVTLVRYPLDFSWVVGRLLDNLRPAVVVLMELEVWPNFLRQCGKRKIPVMVINGRMTPASYARYRMARPLIKGMFRRLSKICAQDEIYAQRFVELGADLDRISVTGTMKFDTVPLADASNAASELAASVGLKPGQAPIWICGSTGPGEEEIVLEQYRKLLALFPKLRLVLTPRHPERFDEVANLIVARGFGCIRRSKPEPPAAADQPVVLGDTMGELRTWYALADVVFVGRSLVDLGARQHGSDMIEPAAAGKPVVVGPFTGNFAEPMARFMAMDAIIVVSNGEELRKRIADLLADPPHAILLGQRARGVVANERGATDRHVKAILAQF